MVYFILIIMILAILLILLAGFYAFKKLSKKYFFLITFLFIGIPVIAFKVYERNFIIGSIPSGLNVKEVLYTKEESWGFGPGGNEAGIRVFRLSQTVTSEITNNGIQFFETMRVDASQRRIVRSFTKWSETPVAPTDYWKKSKETKQLDVYDYVCAYGFCIDIESEMVKLANQMINEPGNYYSFGRIGLIIVSPSKKTVMYLFSG